MSRLSVLVLLFTGSLSTGCGDDCSLDGYPDLANSDFTGCNLSEADLNGADLSGADLRDAALTDADLTGVDFTDANLSGADFTGADFGAAEQGDDLAASKSSATASVTWQNTTCPDGTNSDANAPQEPAMTLPANRSTCDGHLNL